MGTDPQKKNVITRAVTQQTEFTNFESISIVDAGAADGFQVLGGSDGVDKASQWMLIPTGIPYNAGKPDSGKTIPTLSVKAAEGKNLNVSVSIMY